MKSLFNHIQKPGNQQRRTIYEPIKSIKWVRDRALDHAVEKERNLKPMINLKNLLKSEPSKSLPISLIFPKIESLEIPIHPIEFVRNYPTVFEEFLPGGIGTTPHVKLTPQVLDLDTEEQFVYQTEIHKQEVADRLLKLLMVSKVNKIPLHIIDKLKWDLGLPLDYTQSIIPEFPDYFRVSNCNNLSFLELVCWSNELAVSVMEKKAMSGEDGYSKGMPIVFPLQYSRGFEVDKEFEKWVNDWQKLPYVSPYENVSQLKSDESDKWAVGVVHEILSLFLPKKTLKDNIFLLGSYLGVRMRFKRALLQHPGIFYISSKLHTHTVVLREAYKRDLLIQKDNPLMGMRSKYIHLMTMVKTEEYKLKKGQRGNSRSKKDNNDLIEGNEKEFDNDEEQDENSNRMSDSEFEDESEDDDYEEEDDDYEEEEDDDVTEDESTIRPLKTEQKQFGRRLPSKTLDKQSATYSRGKESPRRNERDESSKRHQSKTLDRQSPVSARGRQGPMRNVRDGSNRAYRSPERFRGKEACLTNKPNRSDRRFPSSTHDKQLFTNPRGKEVPENQNFRRRTHVRSDGSRARKSTYPNRTPTY